jgi:beta-D-xylosidase 4
VSVNDTSGIPAAVAACAAPGVAVCVLALGTDSSVAREGLDRVDTALPGAQAALAAAVLAAGKPTVVVLFNGGTLAVDGLLAARGGAGGATAPLALVEAWNPGVAGGTPVADALRGRENRWGKLPVSWPPAAYYGLLPIEDMDMVAGGGGAGRTYK